jgi:uncharacterized repeat protein (TIGR03806 family)
MRKPIYYTVFFLIITAMCSLAIQSCENQSAGNSRQTGGGFEFRERLSDYGFFQNKLSDLEPRANVIHYALSTPLFTDYAVKDRFFILPAGKQIRYTTTGALDFPDSTIIIKNFAYTNVSRQKIMIETRLLVKDPADGKWKVMDYLWNEDQTDAIKHIIGARVPITLLDDEGNKISTSYQVPNVNDCKRCHTNNDVLGLIGPKARNLNFTIDGQTTNQLEQFASKGLLSGLPDIKTVPQLPNWKDDKHFSVEQRARAYLDVNCAHCHTKGGDAYNTGLFLEYQQNDPYHLGVMKAPVSAGGGAGGMNYDVIPGDVAHSILAYRMNSAEPGTAMPELARTVIHKEGVKLISAWIAQMHK